MDAFSFTTVESTHSVAEIVNKLQTLFQTKGIKLFALIDHSGEAQKAQLLLAEEKLLIFGDPKVGTFLMQENPAIGFELPLKVLVWQDRRGKTLIAYTNPLVLIEKYQIVKNRPVLEKMHDALTHLISEISKD